MFVPLWDWLIVFFLLAKPAPGERLPLLPSQHCEVMVLLCLGVLLIAAVIVVPWRVDSLKLGLEW